MTLRDRWDTFRVLAPFHCTGLCVEPTTGEVRLAGPILGYMRGWHLGDVMAYAKKRGWEVEVVEDPGEVE